MNRVGKLRQVAYYGFWLLKSRLGLKKPLVNTMIINYECNLRCKHCSIVAHAEELPGPKSMSYELAVREMKEHYENGARILFFEGGEPTLWRNGSKELKDLIAAGKEIGYFVVGYTTNGTREIVETSDVISVSLDGPKEVHEEVRGHGTFDSLMKNLERTNHPNIFANMVITKMNVNSVKETIELVSENHKIRGIMINFLTPPPNSIALDIQEKRKVVDLVLTMKRQGYPILNTDRALKELLEEDYSQKCPYWVSAFVLPDGSKYFGCPLQNTISCKQCGFNAVREYRLITVGNLQTITQMSRRFALSTQ
ncbi:MAG: radical SAM protein [Methanomassiliicoccales archaeon]|jgi:MoaA/NifB/PqqE/SkfB family radical SAM enzyme|nr:radical SAM protein [Methanomassiliicoccales archaeon]